MHSNCSMSPYQSRVFDRSKNGPYGRQHQLPIEAPHAASVPDTTVQSAPVTPEAAGYYGSAVSSFRAQPRGTSLLSLLTANEPVGNSFTPPIRNPVAPAPPVQPLPHDPSEQVVVSDGCIFYIRYVDESMAESAALVPRSNGDSFCEEESLPSIPNDMSERLLDDSVLSVCGNEYGADEGSVRDWINYDELPLLNQQKQQQQQQQLPVPTDHISGRSSSIDVRVEFERCKNCRKLVRVMGQHQNMDDYCWCSGDTTIPPVLSNPPLPSWELTPTPTSTMLPDFSYYCVECEKFFPSNECLQEHMELNHRMIDETLPVMTTIPRVAYAEQEGSGPSGGYVWPCSTIVDSISNRSAKMPYFCDFCNISFNFADSYYMHNYSVHGRVGTDSQ